jgi:U4/U6 small nuclear ribonucleoprotein PRP31
LFPLFTIQILKFVESRMLYIAPNLSAIAGSSIAARLMGLAGGLGALAKMPACNVQLLGANRKNLAGFSTATQLPHTGLVFHTEIVQQTPPALRMKAARLIAGERVAVVRLGG